MHSSRHRASFRAYRFADAYLTAEIDTDPIVFNRKNALFAGSDGGGDHWAVLASLIETCKLNAVDPQAYLADVISRIVRGHPNSRLDELLPWAYTHTKPHVA